MAHKLADELLKEILSPPLLVDDALFADTGAVSPFSKATYSASDVLLVCKRWMRVGTPALYHTVVVRSLAQAQALASALKRNPEFGVYVKKVRIEGAYSTHLAQVARVCPKITDFCFTLAIWADSNASGLRKLLSEIDPARVIMTTAPKKVIHNKQLTEIVDHFCSCIKTWKKLHTFHYSGSPVALRRWRPTMESEHYLGIARALAMSPSLQYVHFYNDHFSSGFESFDILDANRGIKTFYIHTRLYAMTVSSLPFPETFAPRVKIVPDGSCVVAPQITGSTMDIVLENPFYVPMSNASQQVRHDVWRTIIEFALEADAPCRSVARRYWFSIEHFDFKTAKSLLFVSREFHRTTVTILCRHIFVEDQGRLEVIQNYMDRFSIPGSTIQTFFMNNYARMDVAPLLSTTSGLRVCSVWVEPETLTQLGLSSGKVLKELELKNHHYINNVTWSLKLLKPFTALERLVTFSNSGLRVDSENVLSSSDFNTMFSQLKDIKIVLYDTSILEALAPFRLPNLERLTLGLAAFIDSSTTIFCKAHGGKLKYLSTSSHKLYEKLQMCQALETLEIAREDTLIPEDFQDGHPTLREIKLHAFVAVMPPRGTDDRIGLIVSTFKRTAFPALKTIHILYRSSIWPSSEREIKKSPWPGYAEALEDEGIALLDHTGRAWRRRLTVRGR